MMITVEQIQEAQDQFSDTSKRLEEICDTMTDGIRRMGEAMRYWRHHRSGSPTPRKRRGGMSRKKMGWD